MYTCGFCGLECRTFRRLRFHMESHADDPPAGTRRWVPAPPSSVDDASAGPKEESVASGPEKNVCGVCSLECENWRHLRSHLESHAEDPPAGTTGKAAASHSSAHSSQAEPSAAGPQEEAVAPDGDKLLRCGLCRKTYKTARGLASHYEKTHPEADGVPDPSVKLDQPGPANTKKPSSSKTAKKRKPAAGSEASVEDALSEDGSAMTVVDGKTAKAKATKENKATTALEPKATKEPKVTKQGKATTASELKAAKQGKTTSEPKAAKQGKATTASEPKAAKQGKATTASEPKAAKQGKATTASEPKAGRKGKALETAGAEEWKDDGSEASLSDTSDYEDGAAKVGTSKAAKLVVNGDSERKSKRKKVFLCDECDDDDDEGGAVQFRDAEALRDHVNREHRGERPFKCGRCYSAFFTRRNLRDHERRMHQGDGTSGEEDMDDENDDTLPDKPFKCSQCSASFFFENALKFHVKSSHGELKFECVDCNVKYQYKKNLNDHFKRCHPELYEEPKKRAPRKLGAADLQSLREKIDAIDRVHGGETKKGVAQDMNVPESTLRGWFKMEDELRRQLRASQHPSEPSDPSEGDASSDEPSEPLSLDVLKLT